jgi:hypothetical protein
MCPIKHCIYIVAAKVVLLQVMKWGKTSHVIWASMVCETGYGLETYVGLIAGTMVKVSLKNKLFMVRETL